MVNFVRILRSAKMYRIFSVAFGVVIGFVITSAWYADNYGTHNTASYLRHCEDELAKHPNVPAPPAP
jgi:hypothetical protein